MDDLDANDEWIVNKEDIVDIVHRSIEKHLKSEEYDAAKDAMWVDRICETCTKSLVDLNRPYKYVVTCTILQRNGAGVHTSSSYFWDSVCDVECTVPFPDSKSKNQKRSLCCIVSVGCFAICRP
eukprot:g3386.t1